MNKSKPSAANNRTLTVTDDERALYRERIVFGEELSGTHLTVEDVTEKTICANSLAVLPLLPEAFADLLVLDPPYNLSKSFGDIKFARTDDASYEEYLESWLPSALRLLKPGGSVYLCGDWRCTAVLYNVLSRHATVRNRITWQREKGRGAKSNWKNSCEDIWFATLGDGYYFDVESVKQKRRVLAPYKDNGKPKDWQQSEDGAFRLTYPGNFWDDISIPYWSMPENTEHPTQKPEKLIAKLVLASSPPGGTVLDPFLGSGTTSVTAKKLGRKYVGIEQNEEFCIWAEKRLALADTNTAIQGYTDGVFWERNTLSYQRRHS